MIGLACLLALIYLSHDRLALLTKGSHLHVYIRYFRCIFHPSEVEQLRMLLMVDDCYVMTNQSCLQKIWYIEMMCSPSHCTDMKQK